MNTATATKARETYYVQTRRTDSAAAWETHSWVGTQRTALAHLTSFAERSGRNVIVRVMTGNPYAGEVREVIATRHGVR